MPKERSCGECCINNAAQTSCSAGKMAESKARGRVLRRTATLQCLTYLFGFYLETSYSAHRPALRKEGQERREVCWKDCRRGWNTWSYMIGLQQPIYIMSGYGSLLKDYVFNRFFGRQYGDVMIYSQMYCILRLQSWSITITQHIIYFHSEPSQPIASGVIEKMQ